MAAGHGQGGTVVIVNATNYDWKLTYIHSYQLDAWNFPQIIPAWTKVTVYVEWDERPWIHCGDSGGEAEYTFQENNKNRAEKFQFQARWPDGDKRGPNRHIQVVYTNIAVNDNPVGYKTSLGWKHDGLMNSIITGEPGRYYGTPGPVKSAWIYNISKAWIQTSSKVGNLRTLCIPGSHDAGMWELTHSSAFGYPCNTQTQVLSIGDQLSVGVREFDIRPVIWMDGNYYTGHFSNKIISTLGEQGGTGQSIDSIIDDINTFMDQYPELVILKVSHDFDARWAPEVRRFNQAQYDTLMNKFKKLHFRFDRTGDFDLTSVPITTYVGNFGGGPVRGTVLVVCDPEDPSIVIPNTDGIYSVHNYQQDDDYSDTNNLAKMQSDQIRKMLSPKSDPPSLIPFGLSWILTQSNNQAGSCWTVSSGIPSILDLAAEANPTLYDKVWPAIKVNVGPNTHGYPNVLWSDKIHDGANLAFALAINYWWHMKA